MAEISIPSKASILALLAATSLGMAACQTSSGYKDGELSSAAPTAKPNFAIREDAPVATAEPRPVAPPPAQVATAPPPPPAVATATPPVESRPLAPPPAPSQAPLAAAAVPPAPVTTPPPPPPPAPPRPVATAPVKPPAAIPPALPLASGKVETGRTAVYVVAAGDTLFSIAKRFEATPTEMAELNGFKTGDPIRPGQRLTLPRKYQPAAAQVASAPPLRPTAPPPARVAAAPSQPPAPARSTPVASPTPSAEPTRATPAPAPAPAPAPTPAAPTAMARATPTPSATPSAPAAPAIERGVATAAQVKAAGSGKFIWPVKGRILSGFGPKADGQRNDGINIAAPMNAAVHAAASGEVIYAGDVLREYGNLVLIQHPDGFVTAYGHLAKVNVKMKDKVSQDQEIGQVGDTGGVTQPQLHFETRYARTAADSPAPPVDPLLVLPNP